MILNGDCLEVLKTLPRNSVDMCFTSPNPVFYESGNKNDDVVGAETNRIEYVSHLLTIFDEVKRVLKDGGSLFVQMGDYYIENTLTLNPFLFGIKMLEWNWFLPAYLVWHRPPNKDNLKKHNLGFVKDIEFLFQFTKHPTDYQFYHSQSHMWKSSIFSLKSENEIPDEMIEMCIKLTVPTINGTVLDPMAGMGVTGEVAKRLGRDYILIDIDYEKCLSMGARLGEECTHIS